MLTTALLNPRRREPSIRNMSNRLLHGLFLFLIFFCSFFLKRAVVRHVAGPILCNFLTIKGGQLSFKHDQIKSVKMMPLTVNRISKACVFGCAHEFYKTL